jgi:ABC-type uncharacterized transport system permease subunit
MARFKHLNAIDAGPLYIKNNVSAVWLVPGYTTGMTRSTADTAKIAAEALGSADAIISNEGTGRKLTMASKSGPATGTVAAGSNLHYVYVSATEILYATEETTQQAITAGNPHTFSATVLNYPQPVAP